jgi:erythromycin esterase-like protein
LPRLGQKNAARQAPKSRGEMPIRYLPPGSFGPAPPKTLASVDTIASSGAMEPEAHLLRSRYRTTGALTIRRCALSLVAALSLSASALPAAQSAPPPQPQVQVEEPAPDRAALAAALHDICPKRVALLGEATHGDGTTVAFKAALVQQLVERCHFNAVFFEASHYDFLEFSRRLKAGEPTSPDMIASAAGGLWKFDREFVPLMPFLYAEARAGRVALGGIDDQLGSAGAFYSSDTMSDELTGYLDEPRRTACRDILGKRIYYRFPLYGIAEHQLVSKCMAEIDVALASTGKPQDKRALHRQMLTGIERLLSRELQVNLPYVRGRDRSMYLNFEWLAGRLPPNSKIIVWTATFHAAKDATADPDIGAARNFGSYIHRAYGREAFALGFTALAGSYRYSRKETERTMPPAPPGSLESIALAHSDAAAVYLDTRRLHLIGSVPGRPFQPGYATTVWDRALDGLVVFRKQRPPQRTDGS